MLNPNNCSAYTGRGKLYNLLGESDRAFRDFSQAIKANPSEIESYCERGLIYECRNDDRSALKDYSRALQID